MQLFNIFELQFLLYMLFFVLFLLFLLFKKLNNNYFDSFILIIKLVMQLFKTFVLRFFDLYQNEKFFQKNEIKRRELFAR